MSSTCAIFDIDGTLADCSHRQHLIEHGPDYRSVTDAQWRAFFAGIPSDTLIDPVARMLDGFYLAGYGIVLCTSRDESNREVTEAWLRRQGIPYHALYMRDAKDSRSDEIVKAELLDQMNKDGWRPFIAVEDRQRVVDMWRSKGLICAQVAKGDH